MKLVNWQTGQHNVIVHPDDVGKSVDHLRGWWTRNYRLVLNSQHNWQRLMYLALPEYLDESSRPAWPVTLLRLLNVKYCRPFTLRWIQEMSK